MIVNSKSLAAGADEVRKAGKPLRLAECDVHATAEQLDAAAAILRDGEKSVITSATGVAAGGGGFSVGVEHERPGFIDAAQQDDTGALHLAVGILPCTIYRIDPAGTVTEAER